MAERKKKKKEPIQSRIPSRADTGQAGKKSLMPGLTGAIKASRRRSKKRKDKVSQAVSKAKSKVRGIKSLLKGGKRAKQVRKIKKMQKAGMKVSRVKSVPLKETSPHGRIRKGAKKVLATKGGAYASYGKKSKAAGSFKEAFKKGCGSSESGSFSWDGRSYSCKRAKPSKKQKAVRKMEALPGGLKEPRSYS